jgi:pimeloyl-ACP methyl ester carboxylesterase
MSTFEANGCRLHYDVHGAGPALLFNHGGFGGLGTGLRRGDPPWLESLAAANTVITYDRRSAGRSGTSSGGHTLELFSEDALALLHYLDIDRAVIWGESAGVPIASTFALRYPDRTQALILTDGAPWFSRDADLIQRLKARIQILGRDGPEAAYEARRSGGTVGLQIFSNQRPLTGQEDAARNASRQQIQRQLQAIPRSERIERYAAELRTYAAYLDFDITSRFGELKMPTLVIYGTRDSIFPDVEWEAITRPMPNVTYVPIEGAEHGLLEQPGVLDTVAGFLRAPA